MKNLLILIGYRGSGKTTVGRLLAERMNWEFVDADLFLEERFGRTVGEIFSREGETGFRDKESMILEELCQGTNLVLATGGGVVLRPENRERLKAGWTVWLQASADRLWERIKADASTAIRRPPLAGGGPDEVIKLLSIREPLYQGCADFIQSVDSLSPEEAANAILGAWTQCTSK